VDLVLYKLNIFISISISLYSIDDINKHTA